jgi:hypothetical protein
MRMSGEQKREDFFVVRLDSNFQANCSPSVFKNIEADFITF